MLDDLLELWNLRKRKEEFVQPAIMLKPVKMSVLLQLRPHVTIADNAMFIDTNRQVVNRIKGLLCYEYGYSNDHVKSIEIVKYTLGRDRNELVVLYRSEKGQMQSFRTKNARFTSHDFELMYRQYAKTLLRIAFGMFLSRFKTNKDII